MAKWHKVSESTFNQFLAEQQEAAIVNAYHNTAEELTVYFVGNGHYMDEQWIGKVDRSRDKPTYHIAPPEE